MTLGFIVGITLACAAALLAMGFRHIPRRTRCPKCGRRTDAVLPPPWLKPAQRWLSMRFCAACSWEGIGRRGPALIPGRKIAHDSGFHWGADHLEPDGGFRWATRPEAVQADEPPHHPSGFRFAGPRGGRGSVADDPSGFAWRRDEAAPRASGRPSGSQAREGTRPEDAPDEGGPGFRWGDARRPGRTFDWNADDSIGPSPRR